MLLGAKLVSLTHGHGGRSPPERGKQMVQRAGVSKLK